MRKAAIALVVLVISTVVPTGAAVSADEPDVGRIDVSPSSAPAGSTVTVTGTAPCPAPPPGQELDLVEIQLYNLRDLTEQVIVGTTPDQAGNWTASVGLRAGLRNGGYPIYAVCVSDSQGPNGGSAYYEYLGAVLVSSPAGSGDPALRIAGGDRIATAVDISRDQFLDQSFVAVLSRSDSYADALAGSAFAELMGAPLLLTPGDRLDGRVEAELARVVGEGGEVAVLGGTTAVGPAVVDRLVTLGYAVSRYAGANRYETAVRIAEAGMGSPSTILLADGTGFRDGLIAGAAAHHAAEQVEAGAGNGGVGAVLLTNGSIMPPETRAYLDRNPGQARFAVGGRASGADPSATALAGATAPATSVEVARRFFTDPWNVGIASAAAFPDALAGGAHAPALGGPLLLTDPAELSAPVREYLLEHKRIPIAFLYGGTAALADAVQTAVASAIS